MCILYFGTVLFRRFFACDIVFTIISGNIFPRLCICLFRNTNVKIGAGEYRFTVSASKIAFDGFMSVYTSDDDEKAENNVLVGSIDENTVLNLKEFDEKQHFTQPPAHYTEASLVKTLEELGN